MHPLARTITALAVATLAWVSSLAAAPSAPAALAPSPPITVQLRVEGSAQTLYEGPVSTQGESIETKSSGGPHPCNYSENGNFKGETNGGGASATPTTALHDAALADGRQFDGEWDASLGDFLITTVGGDTNGEVGGVYDYWNLFVSDLYAPVGGCQYALAPGNEVLWAFGANLSHVLDLSGPGSASLGSAFTVHVTDARTGAPLAGAAIGEDVGGVTTPLSGISTNSEGNASVTPGRTGILALKATLPEAVRSNAISICVHNGEDGTCGAPAPPILSCPTASGVGGCGLLQLPPPPRVDTARAGGVLPGHLYRPRRAPRILAGVVTVPAGATLRDVRISLTRRVGKRCFAFSGTREALVRARCGHASFFSVGGSESFSYLLPRRLPRGLYSYEIEAVDDGGQLSRLVPGVSDVVFRVA